MDLLERAALLEELSGALADTAAEGRVVLVAGEAGIGKSTLVRRFTEGQAAQARFLLGACDPLLTPRAGVSTTFTKPCSSVLQRARVKYESDTTAVVS